MCCRNREDLITDEGGVGGASDTESVQLLSISQLTNNQLPPIVYVKVMISILMIIIIIINIIIGNHYEVDGSVIS